MHQTQKRTRVSGRGQGSMPPQRQRRITKAVDSAQPRTRTLLDLETEVILALCDNLQSPRSLMIKLLVENKDWDQIVQLRINSQDYLQDHSRRFRDDYLLTSLLSKSPTLPTSHNRRDEAVKDFYAAEARCAETNERLESYADSKLMPKSLDVHRAIHFAREYILKVLGTKPTKGDLDYAFDNMRFGPGATTGCSGNVTSGAKYSPRDLEVTPRLADFGIWTLPRLWRAQKYGLVLRTTSKFSTVSKNAKKDRGICIEPDLNVYVQLGIGAVLRRALRSSGLDLDHGAEWNRFLAETAVEWRLTTLDLSAASDTVSRQVVWLLVPEAWVQLLLLARVDVTQIDGIDFPLSKWSSMGNGYTFELESLIFWGVLQGCLKVMGLGDAQCACFGDDLIFPTEVTTLVTETLEFLGFKVNNEKSFSTGLFRESCGSDFFDSVPCRPVFFKGQKDDTDTEIDDIQVRYSYANALCRWAVRPGGRDARILPAWLRVFRSVPKSLRLRVPHGAGDGGFAGDWDEAQAGVPCVRPPHGELEQGWGGHYYREYFRPMVLDLRHPYGAYVATLAGQALEASVGQPMRGRFKEATTRWVYTLAWPNRGPWLN